MVSKLDEDQAAKLKKAFEDTDKDANGAVSVDELVKMVGQFCPHAPEGDLKAMMSKLVTDFGGSEDQGLTQDQFNAMMKASCPAFKG